MRRDLGVDPLPGDLWPTAVGAGPVAEAERSPSSAPRSSGSRLRPMSCCAPTSSSSGRRAIVVVSRGGGYGPGTPREGWDHGTAWLVRVLGEVWGAEFEVIEAELTLAEVVPAMAELRPRAAQVRARAHASADTAGAV